MKSSYCYTQKLSLIVQLPRSVATNDTCWWRKRSWGHYNKQPILAFPTAINHDQGKQVVRCSEKILSLSDRYVKVHRITYLSLWLNLRCPTHRRFSHFHSASMKVQGTNAGPWFTTLGLRQENWRFNITFIYKALNGLSDLQLSEFVSCIC